MSYIESIGYLTVTGGEPSLAPEVLEYFIENLYWRKISVESFYITTNGMNHYKFRRFLTAVERLYNWCEDQSSCILTVSRDQFHPFDENTWKNLLKFEMRDERGHSWGEFPPYFRPDDRKHPITRVIGEGRAPKTHAGFEPQEPQELWELNNDRDYVIEPEVYVSANGNVTSSCNMSYNRIDKEARGNILTTSLPAIIESYCIEPLEKVQESIAA
jgi:hypothetical protein